MLLIFLLLKIDWSVSNLKIENNVIYVKTTDTIYTEKKGFFLTRKERSSLTPEERKGLILEFHKGYYNTMDSVAKEEGLPTSLLIGRSVRESAYNTTRNSVHDKNLFGIHWYKNCGYRYKLYKDRDENGVTKLYKFCVYDSYEESIRHFCKFIRFKRYTKYNPYNLKTWAKALCDGGYSTECRPRDDVNAWNLYYKVVKDVEPNFIYTESMPSS